MAVNFLVRNMPQIQGENPYLAEAIQDLIQQISAQSQQLQAMQQTITDINNTITSIQQSLSLAGIHT